MRTGTHSSVRSRCAPPGGAPPDPPALRTDRDRAPSREGGEISVPRAGIRLRLRSRRSTVPHAHKAAGHARHGETAPWPTRQGVVRPSTRGTPPGRRTRQGVTGAVGRTRQGVRRGTRQGVPPARPPPRQGVCRTAPVPRQGVHADTLCDARGAPSSSARLPAPSVRRPRTCPGWTELDHVPHRCGADRPDRAPHRCANVVRCGRRPPTAPRRTGAVRRTGRSPTGGSPTHSAHHPSAAPQSTRCGRARCGPEPHRTSGGDAVRGVRPPSSLHTAAVDGADRDPDPVRRPSTPCRAAARAAEHRGHADRSGPCVTLAPAGRHRVRSTESRSDSR